MKTRTIIALLIAIAVLAGAYIVFRSFFAEVPMQPATGVSVGQVSDYAEGDVKHFPDHKLFVVCRDGKLFAVSSLCTHMKCETDWAPAENEFKCSCHGSKFDKDGNVLNPPADKPLPRFAIEDNGSGGLFVDTARTSGNSDDWGKAPYFVEAAGQGR